MAYLNSHQNLFFLVECLWISVSLPFWSSSPFKIPVSLRNKTDHDNELPSNCIFADLSIPHQLIFALVWIEGILTLTWQWHWHWPQLVVSLSMEELRILNCTLILDSLHYLWSGGNTAQIKFVLWCLLHHDLDFGYATKIKQYIKLKDETPFKQRAHPSHPQYF